MGERKSGCPMRDANWPSGAYAAEFGDEELFVAAVKELSHQGYVRVEAYSPYPVARVQSLLREPRSLLPVVVFIGGVIGAIIGYGIQWIANVVSYPLNIGGRPPHAVPAFVIPTFEATVLCAAGAAFIGLFWALHLPRPWHPMFEADDFDRVMIDRFWIAIDATDPAADRTKTPSLLNALHAERVVRVPSLQ